MAYSLIELSIDGWLIIENGLTALAGDRDQMMNHKWVVEV